MTLSETARQRASDAKDLARAHRCELDVADVVDIVVPVARDFALAVLNIVERRRGRMTAAEKAEIIDLAAGEA